jgi:hypothetical protein
MRRAGIDALPDHDASLGHWSVSSTLITRALISTRLLDTGW